MSEYHEWEIWNGGVCPCPDETVQVQMAGDTRKEAERNHPDKAECFFWGKDGDSSDIIAFRRVKKPETHVFYVPVWQLLKYDAHLKRNRLPGHTHRLIFEAVNGEPVNPRFERIEK